MRRKGPFPLRWLPSPSDSPYPPKMRIRAAMSDEFPLLPDATPLRPGLFRSCGPEDDNGR